MDPSETRGPQLEAVVITLLITAMAANALRCYTRIGIVKAFGLDDWTMLIASLFFTLFCACALAGVHYGTGRHEEALLPVNRERARYFWWLCYIWYGATMVFSKISIGVFLLRVTINRYHVWIVWATSVLTVAGGSALIMFTMFQCMPISAFWREPVDGVGRSACIHGRVVRDLGYAYSAGSMLVDLTLVVLPLMIVWRLKMDYKTKLGISVLICSGLVASVGVGVRFAYLDDFTRPDFLFETANVAIWSAVESGSAIIAGSLATLKPLFRLTSRKLCGTPADATRTLSEEARAPSPRLILSQASLKHDGAISPHNQSQRSSRRDSMFKSTTPNLWYEDYRGSAERRLSVPCEILEEHEFPTRPASTASIAPTLPRLSVGTWKFLHERGNDVETGTSQESLRRPQSEEQPP